MTVYKIKACNTMIDDDYKIIKVSLVVKLELQTTSQKYQLGIIGLCQKYTKNYHDAEEVSRKHL